MFNIQFLENQYAKQLPNKLNLEGNHLKSLVHNLCAQRNNYEKLAIGH